MAKIQKIHINDVKMGMYLASDVYDRNNNLLLSKGIIFFSNLQIEKLKHSRDEYIFIDLDESQEYQYNDYAGNYNYVEETQLINIKPIESYSLDNYKKLIEKTIKFLKQMPEKFDEKELFDISKKFIIYIEKFGEIIIGITKYYVFDDYFISHSINVAVLNTYFSRFFLGYIHEEIQEIFIASLLHDIGKLMIDDSLLCKNDKLNSNDWEKIKKHPQYSVKLVENHFKLSTYVSKIIIQHHERYNGSGYPVGIMKNEIDKSSYALGIADVYDAMTSYRVYKESISAKKALSEIYSWRNNLFPEEFINRFINAVGLYHVGSFVALNSGEIAIVVSVKDKKIILPDVMILFDKKRRLVKPGEIVSLEKTHNGIRNEINNFEFNIDITNYLKVVIDR